MNLLQASGSTSRGAAKRPVTRSQPVLLEQRPNNPPLSTPMVDLTADSSSESSIGSNNGRQVARDSVTTGKRQRFQCDSPPVRFARQFASTSTPHSSTHATYSRIIDSTQQPDGSFVSPQPRILHRAVSSSFTHPAEPPEVSTSSPEIMVSSPEKEVSKDLNPPLIQRPQSCLPPTLHFLYLHNQWLTMPSRSGRLTVAKSQLSFSAIRCGIR